MTASTKVFNKIPKEVRFASLFSRVGVLPPNPVIYPASELSTLLAQKNLMEEGNIVVRFLVKEDGALVFGKEGAPEADVPAHSQLSQDASYLAVGNAFFDESGKLVGLNNKSGDFRPPFDTLQFALESILAAKIPLANKIEIVNVDKMDRNLRYEVTTVASKDLEKILGLAPVAAVQTVRPIEIKSVSAQESKSVPTPVFFQAAVKHYLTLKILRQKDVELEISPDLFNKFKLVAEGGGMVNPNYPLFQKTVKDLLVSKGIKLANEDARLLFVDAELKGNKIETLIGSGDLAPDETLAKGRARSS